MKTAVVVTTYNRPQCLARSLPQIVAAANEVGAPVLVVDDASSDKGIPWNDILMSKDHPEVRIHKLRLPQNRGLAAALNIGLSYWMADPLIEAIHYFQDDVDVDLLAIVACNWVLGCAGTALLTGHDAAEHRAHRDLPWISLPSIVKGRVRLSCRATHMAATRESWMRVLPIPSRGLGLPSKTIRDRNNPAARGTGSGVDWWIVRDSPNKLPVLCIPGLVRSFAHKREDSTWDNESIGGEEPPLSRAAIQEWINARSS